MSNIDSNPDFWSGIKPNIVDGLAAAVEKYGEFFGKLEKKIRDKPLSDTQARELAKKTQNRIRNMAGILGSSLASIDARGIATSKVDIIVFNKLKSVASQLDNFSRSLDFAIAYDDVSAMAKKLKTAGKVFGAVATVLFTTIDVANAIGRGDWRDATHSLVTGAVGFVGAAAFTGV